MSLAANLGEEDLIGFHFFSRFCAGSGSRIAAMTVAEWVRGSRRGRARGTVTKTVTFEADKTTLVR
jgi:hypothetical protein